MSIPVDILTTYPLLAQAATILLLVAALLLLLSTYQLAKPLGRIFWVFMMVSAAAMLWPRALWMSLSVWLMMALALDNLSARTFLASLLGLLTPPWLLLPWLLWTERMAVGTRWMLTELTPQWPPVYDDLPLSAMLVWLGVALWAVSCQARYLRGRSEYRLRVRRVFRIFAFLPWLLLAWAALIPADGLVVLPLVAVTSLITSRLWMPSSSS